MIPSVKTLLSESRYLTIKNLKDDYPLIQVEHPNAKACLALHGAHLTSWQPAGETPVLYTSPDAIYRKGKAIRGGIPICWPWFGANAENPSLPAHGFARTHFWDLLEVEEESEGVILRLTLDVPSASPAPRFANLQVALTLSIGRALSIELKTKNTDCEPITVTSALHSYFAIGAIDQTTVEGLEESDYLNTVGKARLEKQSGPIRFDEEIDRIYQAAPDIQIKDPVNQRSIHIASRGSNSTVVWNPYVKKARVLKDLPNEAYQDFVCVETANAEKDARRIRPNEKHTLGATVRVVH